jgi:hypothetical protein
LKIHIEDCANAADAVPPIAEDVCAGFDADRGMELDKLLRAYRQKGRNLARFRPTVRPAIQSRNPKYPAARVITGQR